MVTISQSKVSAGIAIIVMLIIVFIFSFTFPNLQAQTNIFFSPSDNFSIPAYNGTISFAVNGSYSKAIFENDSWTFMNLNLNGSLPIQDLDFSAQNCNVTIFSYEAVNTTTFNILRLRYVVEGRGIQTLNLGLGSEEAGLSANAEWSVIFGNAVVVDEGNGWNVSNNGTLIVTGASGNVTIAHYVFLAFENNSNLPYYQQHSVAIIAAIGFALTIIIAVVIKVRAKEDRDE